MKPMVIQWSASPPWVFPTSGLCDEKFQDRPRPSRSRWRSHPPRRPLARVSIPRGEKSPGPGPQKKSCSGDEFLVVDIAAEVIGTRSPLLPRPGGDSHHPKEGFQGETIPLEKMVSILSKSNLKDFILATGKSSGSPPMPISPGK